MQAGWIPRWEGFILRASSCALLSSRRRVDDHRPGQRAVRPHRGKGDPQVFTDDLEDGRIAVDGLRARIVTNAAGQFMVTLLAVVLFGRRVGLRIDGVALRFPAV